MALVEIEKNVERTEWMHRVGREPALATFAVDGATIYVRKPDGAEQPIYSKKNTDPDSAAVLLTQPIKSVNGRIEAWVEQGLHLDLHVSKPGEIQSYVQRIVTGGNPPDITAHNADLAAHGSIRRGVFVVPAATGVLATDSANILQTIQDAAAAKGVCEIRSHGARYVCSVTVSDLNHVKIRGDATLHNPTAGADVLTVINCPEAEVIGPYVQGEAGTRDGVHVERSYRAKVKVRCQGTGRYGVYAQESYAIEVDSQVGIDVASPFPTGVTNCTGGVVLSWNGVSTDSGCNQFRLAGWYVIGKDRGWAVEIIRAEGGSMDSLVPELSKGGIKLDTCQHIAVDSYYGEANPSDIEYSAGTASVTNGSTTVTGTGTAWNTLDPEGVVKNAAPGKYLIIGTVWKRIAQIVSDTEVVLESAWTGATLTGQAYTMMGVDLHMKDCFDCPVLGGRGGGAVLLEGSYANLLQLTTERIFLDAASNDNWGMIVTNRASTTTNPARLVDGGARNRFVQINHKTKAFVKDDTARLNAAQTWSGAQTMNAMLALYDQANNGVALAMRAINDPAVRVAWRNTGLIEVGDGTNARDTKLQRAQAGVWRVDNAIQLVAIAAASVPNNSIFLDSADNIIKRKDNAGAVAAI